MDSKSTKTHARKFLETTWWLVKDQWFVIGVGLVIAISSQVNVPASHQTIKQTVVSYLSVSIIFFITGCTLPTRVLIDNGARWKLHLFVQGQCFLLTSALGFAIVSAAASNRHFLDPWLLLGLILSAVLPTTIASNVVMTKQAGGNQALTVVQTAIGNFIGVFLSPVLFRMYVSVDTWYTAVLPSEGGGKGYQALYSRVFMQCGLSIYLPLVVGQALQYFFPQIKAFFQRFPFNKLSSAAMLCLIWQTFDRAFQTGAFHTVSSSNMIFIVFISIANWLLWLIISFVTSVVWLGKKDVISVCYCVPAKTLTVGVPLSIQLYANLSLVDEAKLQIPMVVFQAFQVLFSSILTIPFRRWVETDEKELEKMDQERAGQQLEQREGTQDHEKEEGPLRQVSGQAKVDSEAGRHLGDIQNPDAH